MREVYRILDANLNRAREALRIAEDCGRFALNDPAITAMAKTMGSDLRELLERMPQKQMIASRDTPGDIGTELTSPSEPRRKDLQEVATAACKRLSSSLRAIEELSKIVAPELITEFERMRYNGYTLEQRIMQRFFVAGRFAKVRLYVLISHDLCTGSLRETARAAIAGGADAIQLREKDLDDNLFLALAAELRELTDETGRIFIVNDRPDIAAVVGADGVHLGHTDLPVAEARKLLRPGAIVGRTTHSIREARAILNECPDYIAVGPMYPSSVKPELPVAGPDLLRQAAGEFDLPVVAVGGIHADNAGVLVDAGATCLAASTAVCSADDPKAAAEAIKKAFERPDD